MNDTWVIIPSFNEGKRLEHTLKELSEYNVIVVNDGSTDGTENISVKHLLTHKINLGQGAALQTGFDYVKRFKPKYVITMDADGNGSHPPQTLRSELSPR